MKIRLGKNYWVEIITAKHCDRKYGSNYAEEGALILINGIRLDTEKSYKEERYSDTGVIFKDGTLRIISRGTYCKCTVKEFVDNLRWTLN